jgi:two-component system, cell cycle sensor histidine kinase and response regulator CckA
MTAPTILVVEDNPITRKMLRVTLETEGFTALEAPDGATALAVLARETPALVLQDYVLPDMSGAELLKRIRRLPNNGALPVVLLTGLASKTAEFAEAGDFTAVLAKPVEPSRILEVVRSVLAARKVAAPQPALAARRVLVVDDEPANRRLAEVHLKAVGYRPTTVATVEAALVEARRERPDVILGDVLMPGLDGFQMCLAARRDQVLATVPIVLISSAYTEEADRKLALLVGAAGLVQRTPALEEAIAAIEAACAPGAPAPAAAGPALDQQYLASLRRQIDRQMAHNAELAKRAGIQAAALSMVGALAQALANPSEISAVLGDVLVHCLDAAGLSAGVLYLRGPGGALELHSMAGLGEELRGDAQAAFGHPALLARDRGDPVAFNAAGADARQREFLARLKRRSVLIVPFVVMNQHYGTLVLASDQHDLADRAWGSFASALAAQFGQAVALGRSMSQLAESDALLRSAVEASPHGMIMSDAQGRIVMVNRRTEEMFGYGDGELTGSPLENLLPTRHRTAHVGHRAAFAAHPHARAMGASRELLGLHKSGREIPVEIGLAPVTRGGERFVIASVVDITERRKAEAQIRWLSHAVDQGPTSVVMTDVTGSIEYVNPKFTEVTGYTLDEVRGKNPRLLRSGETPPAVYRELWAAITGGQSWHGELLNRKKDGTTYWDDVWVYPVRDAGGSVTRFLALKEDITERKQSEGTLRDSEAYHRAVLESIGDAVFIVNTEGQFIDVNPKACEMTGYTRAEMLRLRVADTCLPEERAEADLRVARVLGGDPVVIERPLVRKDGSTVIVESNARILSDGRMLATVRDITERRSLEQQLRQAQKMEAVGRLAGGVAHDFNNVLTAIFGYTELLTEGLPADSEMRGDLGEIHKAAQRAAGLTRQLLAFSRQQVMQPVVLNVNDVVENLDKMLHRLVGEDIEVHAVLGGDIGNVRADPGQLEQVVMNLVVNARDAMPDGGKLTIETINAELSEQYAEMHQPVVPGHYVMLAVSDTGTGMTPEVKTRLFEPFFTTKEQGKGTGLGLATVYGIVKQSGGYIWAYSELGHGATFKVYLPRVDAPVDTAVPVAELSGGITGTETIMLAEDDELLRPLATSLLKKLGYTVLEAQDAPSALARAAAHDAPIHLLITDVVMPGVSGRELARKLAAVRPDALVLYISGYTDDAIVRHGMLEPGLNYLQKPFTPAALARKVREVLEAK